MRRFRLALLAAFFAQGACHAQGADYEIKLARAAQPGERYSIQAEGEQLRQTALRSGDRTIRGSSEGFKVELSGEATVLEADAKGTVTRALVKVNLLVRVLGLQRDEMLPAGTLVTEERAGARQRFLIDGREAAPLIKDLLEVVLSETNDPGAPSDDELMGTRERKKVGERWPVSRAGLARFITQDPDINLEVKPEDVEGAGTLAAIEKVDGLECQRIDIAFTMTGAPRAEKALEPGPKTRIGVRASSLLPVDTRLDALAQSTELVMTYSMQAMPRPGRPPEEMVATWTQRTARQLRPLR